MKRELFEIGFVGAPNVGKSSLFNALTGGSAKVSNWPGTTVEKKTGIVRFDGAMFVAVDLPGLGGFRAYSLDERVSKDYILRGDYKAVVAIADLTSLERSLYVAIVIAELSPRTIIAINKIDLMPRDVVEKFIEYLSKKLHTPVVGVSALKRIGIEVLIREITRMAESKCETDFSHNIYIDYEELNKYIDEIKNLLEKHKSGKEIKNCINLRGLAANFMTEDPDVERFIRDVYGAEILNKLIEIRERAKVETREDLGMRIVSLRYGFIKRLLEESGLESYVEKSLYEKTLIDRIIEAPGGSILIFLGILTLIFFAIFTINTGFPLNVIFSALGLEEIASLIEAYSLNGLISAGFSYLSEYLSDLMTPLPYVIKDLVINGIVTGVGAVISFLPLILLVSISFAVLEDSGIATRLAVGIHRTFSKFGFSGRFVYPMIVSLGCNVPGVMLSRTALTSRERLIQILSTPFIPCQARLIVALAFSQAVFPGRPLEQALLIVLIYVVGFLVSLLSGFILSRSMLREKDLPELIIELPRLHRPYARVVWWISWSYTREFLIKAGLVIFLLSIVVWSLTSFSLSGYIGGEGSVSESIGFMLGSILQPLLSLFNINSSTAPILGFTLIQGFVAKEGLISSLAIIMNMEDPVEAIRSLGLLPAQAISILLFMMLYIPCLATVSVIYEETKSLRWTLFSVVYMIIIAFLISYTAYILLLSLGL